jgi:hypothetical protein
VIFLKIKQAHLWRLRAGEGIFELGSLRFWVLILGGGFGGVHFQVGEDGLGAG